MRGEHGREGNCCDYDTSALAGHLKGRRSSAVIAEVAVAAATCCANSHRFVWDHPTQLQLLLFTCTKTGPIAHPSKMYPRIVAHGRPPIGQRIFQEDRAIVQFFKKWRTSPGGTFNV